MRVPYLGVRVPVLGDNEAQLSNLMHQGGLILSWLQTMWNSVDDETCSRLYDRLQDYVFQVEDCRVRATERIQGRTGPVGVHWIHASEFLTYDHNLDYLLSSYVMFDAAMCGPVVFVGPQDTGSATPNARDTWSVIPAVILKEKMNALIEAGVNTPKSFIIEVRKFDNEVKSMLSNMLYIWRNYLPDSKKMVWLLTLEVLEGSTPFLSEAPFYDFLDSLLDLNLGLVFRKVGVIAIEQIVIWMVGSSFNQHGVLQKIEMESVIINPDSVDDPDYESNEEDEEEQNQRKLDLHFVARLLKIKQVPFYYTSDLDSSVINL